MILAAGLTPAWQHIVRLAILQPGEVNRAAEAAWCASGKAINVGMALAALGAPCRVLAPLGGWSGQAIEQEFRLRSLNASWIAVEPPTRVCTTLLDAATGTTTEIVENAAALGAPELQACGDAYRTLADQATLVVLSGSLPRGTPPELYRTWLAQTRCPVILDIRGPELLECLPLHPRVVKPNREELAHTLGRPLVDRTALLGAMRELLERGAQAVVITQGDRPLLVAEGTQWWELTPARAAPIVNPIGCGDCLAAGLAWGLEQGRPFIEAIQIGMAAAAENVSHLLPARIDPERLPEWQRQIAVRRLDRVVQ